MEIVYALFVVAAGITSGMMIYVGEHPSMEACKAAAAGAEYGTKPGSWRHIPEQGWLCVPRTRESGRSVQ